MITWCQGLLGRELGLRLLEPTLGANQEVTRRREKVGGTVGWSADHAGRPTAPQLQPLSTLVFGLSWCPLSQIHVLGLVLTQLSDAFGPLFSLLSLNGTL